MRGMIASLQRRRLRRALERLTPVQRKIFIASSVEGLPYDEIAERLAITPREVERHLADALTGLLRAMDRDIVERLARFARSRW